MAEPDAYLMSPAYKLMVDEVVARVLGRIQNTTGRPDVVNDTQWGARTYLALTPSTGIPAMSRSGTTGTGSPAAAEDDTFGYAACNIYRCDNYGLEDGLPVRPVEITGLRKTPVVNVGPLALAGNVYVLVTRDEFGTWYALGPMGVETTTC